MLNKLKPKSKKIGLTVILLDAIIDNVEQYVSLLHNIKLDKENKTAEIKRENDIDSHNQIIVYPYI